MDYAVESLKKTSDIERKATINKLHNMQWLKNTSHSANPEKIKAVVYKQEDENKKIEEKVSALTETIKIYLSEESKRSSTNNKTCKTYLYDDTMPESDENVWNKDVDTANLFPNADKLADQENEEGMLSIVESIVTAKLEAEFCINKKDEDQSNTSENNAEHTVQDAICPSNLQTTKKNAEELKLIKHSDGNNNDPKSPCMSKVNDNEKPTCEITNVENSKTSTEIKDKDVHIKTSNITKPSVKAGSNINLTKDERSSSLYDSKKAVSNSSKLLSIDRNGKDHFNNKQNNVKNACMKKQEFTKQRNVFKNGIEKEKSAKPNLTKTAVETSDITCQSKNPNKDKVLQKQQQTTSKQFALKSRGQESLRKNASTLNFSDDKNKTEKATHIPENIDPSSNESERKNEKIVNEKSIQSDQKVNRGDFRKNTFIAQFKNSTFSKPTQNIPRTGQAPMYGRNPSYAYNYPKFDRDRGAERRAKKEHVPVNTKSNIGTEELDTSNLENCAKKKEVIQQTNVKSTYEVDTLVLNDKKDIDPVKVETYLIEGKKNTNSSVDHPEQGPTTSEQCCVETNDTSKVNIDQQRTEANNEKTDSFKHSSGLPSDKVATNSQINAIHQYSLKLENVQRTNDVNQLESSKTTWNQSSDNVAQKDATIMNLQQSIQSMHFNTQQTFTQAGNPTRQMSPWEPPSNGKFYDQHFSVSDAMRLSQIPNTFNASPYECNTQMSSDDSVTTTSTLETAMSNRENSNVLYRYAPNVQQRPVMASDFPGHSVSPCQTRWSSSVQDGFHIEHPYATQPAIMHIYNPAAFGPDDFNNTHTMDYVSHPVIYAPSPYMQTWNSQLQYPMPVLYNSSCTNYTTFSQTNQPNNFNNSMHDQQYKHNSYAQMNNYVRDTYNDTNICAAQARNTADNVPIKSNYYYKKYQDNCRAVYDVPQYIPPVSYSRSQQGMNFMPVTGTNQYNAPYCPNQKHKQNMTNYMKNPKSQIQDFVCDDNSSGDAPPIISPTEFVTDNINLSNKTDQFSTRVFKPEFKTRSNSGYRPPPSLSRYSGCNFRRNTTFQDFPREYTYPISIGRGTYKTKKT